MINKSIDSITKDDIETLILNQVSESRTLEYKEKLPGNSDEDKREFLKDVSAFANTSGGDILYGISEQRDSNGKTTGLPDQAKGLSSINADEQKRRLYQINQVMIQIGLWQCKNIESVMPTTLDSYNSTPLESLL